MSYFITDVKMLYKNRILRWMLLFLIVIMVLDPVSIYIMSMQYTSFAENIGANSFQFWLLMNSSNWGNTVFYAMLWAFPVLSTGLVFYNERCSSMFELLIIRGSRLKYYLSKALAVFVVTLTNFFVVLSINVMVTYTIFSHDAPMTKQYAYILPKEGMFSYPFYQNSPLSMVMLYTFLNAFTIALFALFVFAVHVIIKLKNRYVALLFPFLFLYLMNYAASLLLRGHQNYNLSIIIQPRAASALVAIIQSKDVVAIFLLISLIDLILLVFGYLRNREVL